MSEPAATGADPWRTFAQVDVAGMLIGIPADCVLRAVPRPASLTSLPRSKGEIDGVFREGEQLVVVVNLRSWMAQPPPRADEGGHVMLLAAHGRSIGLAIDAVRGMVRLRSSRIETIHHAKLADGFFHSVAKLDDGGLMTLLDADILLDQLGAWAPGVDIRQDQAAAQAQQQHAGMQAVVRIGPVLLAIPAASIAEIVRQPAVQPLGVSAGAVSGMMTWRAGLTPVIDAAASALQLPGGRDCFVIIVDGDGSLALPVDEVLSVCSFDLAQTHDAAQAGLDATCYTGASKLDDGRPVRMLAVAALLERYGVRDSREQLHRHAAVHNAVPAHVVFDIGHRCATPMSALREIIPLPDNYRVVAGLAERIDGQCVRDGHILPVVDLRQGAAREQSANACLMVSSQASGDVGFLVSGVVSLVPANTAQQARFAVAGGASVSVITVGSVPDRISYQVCDVGSYLAQAGSTSRAAFASKNES